MATLLKLNNVSKIFNGVTAVNNVSVNFEKGQITGIIGPNGAGKTTLINLITSIEKADTGKIHYKGNFILNHMLPYNISKLGIARTFQLTHELNEMSVIENVLIGNNYFKADSILYSILSLKKMKDKIANHVLRASELLENIGIIDLADQPTSILSSGQRKMIGIARAIMAEPDLLILDEPTAGTSVSETNRLLQMIASIHKEKDTTIIIIEHKMEVINRLCEKVIVLDAGKLIAQGTPSEIGKNPVVRMAYLGNG